MRNRILVLFILIVLFALVLLGCSMGRGGVSSVTATPTKTLRPLFTTTFTPTATPQPSATALPTDTAVVPTDVPPTDTPAPSDTPPPSAAPTDTAVVPTDVPPTDTPAPPTETPRPKPTNIPAPPTNTPKPRVDFIVQEIIAFEDGSLTSSGFHNIYFTVVDGSGQLLSDIILEDVNSQPPIQVITGSKGPGKAEWTMFWADYNFRVAGDTHGNIFSSEVTHVLSVIEGHPVYDDLIRGGICTDEASCRALGSIHYSYNVTFQRTW